MDRFRAQRSCRRERALRSRSEHRRQQAAARPSLRGMGDARAIARGGHRRRRYGPRRSRPQPRSLRLPRTAGRRPAPRRSRNRPWKPQRSPLLRPTLGVVGAVRRRQRDPRHRLHGDDRGLCQRFGGGAAAPAPQDADRGALPLPARRSWLRSGIEKGPLDEAWREAIEWFGPPDGDTDALHNEGALSMGPAELRARLEERLETQAPGLELNWKTWDPKRRRTRPGAIDERTFGMLRGLEEKRFAPAGTTKA